MPFCIAQGRHKSIRRRAFRPVTPHPSACGCHLPLVGKALTKAMDGILRCYVRDSLLFCSLIHRMRQPQIYTSKAFRPVAPHPSAFGCHLPLVGKALTKAMDGILRCCVRDSLLLYSLIHLIGQLQSKISHDFSPDGTSSVSLRLPPSPRGEGSGHVQDVN